MNNDIIDEVKRSETISLYELNKIIHGVNAVHDCNERIIDELAKRIQVLQEQYIREQSKCRDLSKSLSKAEYHLAALDDILSNSLIKNKARALKQIRKEQKTK